MGKIIRLVLLIVFATGSLIVSLTVYIKNSTSHLIETDINKIPEYEYGIILGASVYSDYRLSPALKSRADSAIKLFKNKKINKILISGDGRNKYYDEVEAIKRYLIQNGITQDRLILDKFGLDTYDSLSRAKKNFKIDRAIIISQTFHLYRSIFIGKKLGIDVVGYDANPKYSIFTISFFREVLSNVKAFFEVIVLEKANHLVPIL